MYTISSYLAMVTDSVRFGAYREGIEKNTGPGRSFLDLGAGIGLFAMLAARAGAKPVYAVEPDVSLDVAKAIARKNGCLDEIEWVSELSSDLNLDERVDVIAADVSGILPLFQTSLPTLIDARDRLLAPDGVLLPSRDRLFAALAHVPEPFPFDRDAIASLPFDVTPALPYVLNTSAGVRLDVDALLSQPAEWATLDYGTVTAPDARGSCRFTAIRSGAANALCLWFDRELTGEIGFPNAPGGPRTLYGQAAFPLEQPLELAAGDTVAAEIEAHLVEGDYVWRWQTTHMSGSGTRVEMDQSSIKSRPMNLALLHQRAVTHQPNLSQEGHVDGFILSQMNGEATLTAIAERTAERFPERFSDSREVLARVAELSAAYSA
ncbi:MAG: 50S ribosomal protein L11 methyltransferase [Solirubrobacterales bacterium]